MLRNRQQKRAGLSPIFVLLGAVSMTASVVLTGVLTLKHWGEGRAAT